MEKKTQPKRRRRSKVISLNAEIRQSAKQIYESGMAEAMKAAAVMICTRKLEEIRGLLQAAGINANTMGGMVVPSPTYQTASAPQPPRQPEGPACFSCGRPAVRKSRPNRWNPQGSWACQTHVVLLAKDEMEDRLDNVMAPVTEPPPKVQPQQVVKIVTNAPPTIAQQMAEEPAGEASLGDAMAALGVS